MGLGNTHLFRRQGERTKGLAGEKDEQLVHFSEIWWGGRTRRVSPGKFAALVAHVAVDTTLGRTAVLITEDEVFGSIESTFE